VSLWLLTIDFRRLMIVSTQRREPAMHPLVPETELRILIALLCLGKATSPELAAYLTSESSPLSANTVKGLLHRLRQRGYVDAETLLSSRIWSVKQERIMEVLKCEAEYVVKFRHLGDPVMLGLLLREIQSVLESPASSLPKKLQPRKPAPGLKEKGPRKASPPPKRTGFL
jgi:hypothetical protein